MSTLAVLTTLSQTGLAGQLVPLGAATLIALAFMSCAVGVGKNRW